MRGPLRFTRPAEREARSDVQRRARLMCLPEPVIDGGGGGSQIKDDHLWALPPRTDAIFIASKISQRTGKKEKSRKEKDIFSSPKVFSPPALFDSCFGSPGVGCMGARARESHIGASFNPPPTFVSFAHSRSS